MDKRKGIGYTMKRSNKPARVDCIRTDRKGKRIKGNWELVLYFDGTMRIEEKGSDGGNKNKKKERK